jgi:hypothetical protein
MYLIHDLGCKISTERCVIAKGLVVWCARIIAKFLQQNPFILAIDILSIFLPSILMLRSLINQENIGFK